MFVRYVMDLGTRWRSEVPRTEVARRIDALHVDTTESEIVEMIIRAISLSNDREKFDGFISRATIRYALRRHRRNRQAYRKVMFG